MVTSSLLLRDGRGLCAECESWRRTVRQEHAHCCQADQGSSPTAAIHLEADGEKIILLFSSVPGLKNDGNNPVGLPKALNVIMCTKCFVQRLAQ